MKSSDPLASDINLDDLLGGGIDLDPETVEKGLVKLVLMVVETLRQVIESQALRRVETGSLNDDEVERMGLALLRLEQRMAQLKETFGLLDSDLQLRLRLPLDLSE
jgi:hypothetical protein